jgi:hypothetical protein
MSLPKYDVLMPTLFVALIFPAAAGGWWRYFSGHADQMANPAVHMQMTLSSAAPNPNEQSSALLAAHRVADRGSAGASGRRPVLAERPVKPAPAGTEFYISPTKPQACGIVQASSGFDGSYLSAEAGE